MNGIARILLAASATLLLAGPVSGAAGITLNAARVTAEDVAKLGKFYEAAFGLKEVQRLQLPDGIEIMLNFGDTVAAAKANQNAQVVIMHRGEKEPKDGVAHLIFDVTDIKAAVAAVKAAGGTLEREPFEFGKSGIFIAVAVDPAGNHVELIQRAKH
jgi:predicted enzyme related to lactoylglutathione lyase